MKYSEESRNKHLKILPKAEKDLLRIAVKRPLQYKQIAHALVAYLKFPLKADCKRIKYFTNYSPEVYELKLLDNADFYAFFRVYEKDKFIELERVITKLEAEKILKNYF
ncbi:MAG: hypothetical protein SFU25_09110 [Candidatus Caenarcaniphilales bacterium]|nr:hypothetical protein [Candidatus Caenarcaniphilales bacterium]